jgi:hypothetical protein
MSAIQGKADLAVVVTSCGAVRGLLDATKYRSACPQLEDTAFLNPATTRTAFI